MITAVPDSKKRLLDIDAVAAFCSLSRRAIYRLLDDPGSGFPQGKKIRGSRRWTLDSLEKWVARTPDIDPTE